MTPTNPTPEPDSWGKSMEGFNAGAEWMRKRNADRIAALEDALRELNEALDACWNDPHRIYKTHDERHRKAITAAQIKSRRALTPEGETHE